MAFREVLEAKRLCAKAMAQEHNCKYLLEGCHGRVGMNAVHLLVQDTTVNLLETTTIRILGGQLESFHFTGMRPDCHMVTHYHTELD